ncbi:MAG: hypothetical protein JXA89_10840 [Anaerolineae bacterium]|nr:hypothetical protein [Anaerolineae bacterium]
MAGKWETKIGQLRLIDGNRQDSPDNLAVVERRAFLPFGGRGKGQLCVLVELSGGRFGRDQLCQELVAAIAEEYTSSRGTITYGLRQAVLLANTILVRDNAKVTSEHRLGGVACVVLRDGELFIAQAGWPMIYLVQRGKVRAFPDAALEGEDASMLGQNQTTQVRLFHAMIQPGDMILVADGPMARQLGITRIGQIVVGSIERSMHNLEALAPPEDCTAVVVQIGGTPAQADSQAENWEFLEVETSPESKPPERVVPGRQPIEFGTTRAQSGPQTRPEIEAEPEDKTGPIPAANEYSRHLVPIEEPEVYEPEPEYEPETDLEPEPYVQRASQTGTQRRRGTSGGLWQERVLPVLNKIGQGARTLGERILPDSQPGGEAQRTRQRRGAARSRRRRGQTGPQVRGWVAAAIAIPIVVLLFVFGYSWYRDWSHKAQFSAKLEALRSKRDIALSSSESPVIARDYWHEVLVLADDAAAMQPEDVEVAQIRTQAETELDRIDGVRRLGQPFRLYEYTQTALSSGRVIVAGLDVYVLDRGAGIVYHHALNETRDALRDSTAEQVLLKQGQPVETYNVGPLIDIAWMKDGGERQAGALLILDANGLLLEYDPTWEKIGVQTVGGVDSWRNPTAIDTYDSNLYLLDSMANQVFKYWNQQYDAEPTRWLTQESIDLTKAVDMGIDGNIYLVHRDGRLTKYFGGEAVSFVITRMPLPLANADALYMDVEDVAQYLYIADSVEGRVVQLDREGAFVRQFKPARGQESVFASLAGIFVDERDGKLYYLASSALYVADLPPLP